MSYPNIPWTPKARGLVLKSSPIALKFHRRNSSTTADSPVKLPSDRGICNINIAASILQESWCQLSPNRYRSAGRNGKMAPGPILRIRRGHPPPHRYRTAIVETHNTKTLKPKTPLRSAATAPHKWKRTLTLAPDQPTVRQFVPAHPKRFLGIFLRTHGRNGLKLVRHADVSWPRS